MKKKIIFTLLFGFIFLFNSIYVNADCKDEIISASNVFAYSANVLDGIDVRIEIVIEGMTENTYAVIRNNYNNEVVTVYYEDTTDGTYRLKSPNIYKKIKYVVKTYTKSECLDDYVSVYNIETNNYNKYSMHDVCTKGYDLEMCQPFYDIKDMSEKEFIEKAQAIIDEYEVPFSDKLLEFVKKYIVYVLVPISVISLIFIFKVRQLKRSMKDE